MTAALPRGVRNNNPGNIDFNRRNKWVGQIGVEKVGRFAVFDKPENGIRALGKLILNYRGKDGMPGVGGPGIDTVMETMNRWAPNNENDTAAYVKAVAGRLGVSGSDIIDVRQARVLRTLVGAIIAHECNNYRYPEEIFNEGIRLALVA